MPGTDLSQCLRIVLNCLEHAAQLRDGVVQLCGHRGEAIAHGGEGLASGQQSRCGPEPVDRAVVAGKRLASPMTVREMGYGIGQHVLTLGDPLQLVGVIQLRRCDLVDLMPQEIHLLRPRPRIASERRQVFRQRPQLVSRCRQRAHIDAAPAVQRLALCSCPQQRLVLVLAVKVDELGPELGELGCRRHPAVCVGTAATGRGDHAAQHAFAAVRAHEPALDDCLGSAGTHHRRIGSPSHQQLYRLHHKRLAGARLTGQRRHAIIEHQIGPRDDAEIAHRQLGEHQRSLRPNLCFSTRWKLSPPAVTKRAS